MTLLDQHSGSSRRCVRLEVWGRGWDEGRGEPRARGRPAPSRGRRARQRPHAERGSPAPRAVSAVAHSLRFPQIPTKLGGVRGPALPAPPHGSTEEIKYRSFCILQVNYILESRASTARADYFAQKQRKLSRRTSFSFQKEKKSGQQ